jgi:hypothetical protein
MDSSIEQHILQEKQEFKVVLHLIIASKENI